MRRSRWGVPMCAGFLWELFEMSKKFLISSAALLALTACGGGGDGGTGVDLDAGDASFGGLVAETERLTSYFDSTPTASLPTSETVNYDGVILMGDDLDPSGGVSPTGYLGQVDITVTFAATASLAGTASNFFEANLDSAGDPDSEVSAVSGGLTFSGSGITGNNFAFTADGTVDGNTVDGDMTGGFALSNAKAIIGVSDGANFLVNGSSWDAALAADDRDR